MTRAIVDYSLPAPFTAARACIRETLENAGFTGSDARYEVSGEPLVEIVQALHEVLRIISEAGSVNAVSIRLDEPTSN